MCVRQNITREDDLCEEIPKLPGQGLRPLSGPVIGRTTLGILQCVPKKSGGQYVGTGSAAYAVRVEKYFSFVYRFPMPRLI